MHRGVHKGTVLCGSGCQESVAQHTTSEARVMESAWRRYEGKLLTDRPLFCHNIALSNLLAGSFLPRVMTATHVSSIADFRAHVDVERLRFVCTRCRDLLYVRVM